MLARSLNIIRSKQFTDLVELNSVRNRCSHNWILSKLTRRRIKPSKSKRPLLRWRGTNLYKTDEFMTFVAVYSRHYVDHWLRYA
jgi:hypothetical protein